MLRYLEIKKMLVELMETYQPGGKLPSRPLLCKRFDTTRATLDKAVAELVEEGVLLSKNGSGTYVAAFSKEESDGQHGAWGILVPNVMDAIYPGMVRGVENIAQKEGFSIILCNSDNNAQKQEQYIRRLLIAGVEGFIIVPVITNDPRADLMLYSQLINAKMPFVFCNRSIEGVNVPVISSSGFYGGYTATRHLIRQGYRRIAYIARQHYRTSLERCHGYISALKEYGLAVDEALITLECEPSAPTGFTEMTRMLQNPNPPDAVFCFNDQIAVGVCEAIKQMGLRISDDVGVIGYDNEDSCNFASPTLTSVSYCNYEIGQKAAKVLLGLIHGEAISHFPYYTYQPYIVQRNSCLGKVTTDC